MPNEWEQACGAQSGTIFRSSTSKNEIAAPETGTRRCVIRRLMVIR
jgi:hypothetical protein